ncbi:unnamed protein product [Adineta ricciae]|uniref:DUF4773 domain-containing protein n=1 Tax=Adineta ricciae TaxID=249248 RepID=A0A815D290_ADIRI|nr:unnamed protein product [Adineta ricciae]
MMTSKLWYIFATTSILMTVIKANAVVESDSAAAPDWIGIWSTDTKCNKLACCCLFDQITTSAVANETKLRIIGQVDGIGICRSNLIVFSEVNMPKDFKMPFDLFGFSLSLSLSEDSKVISAINPKDSQCNTIATRLHSAANRIEVLFSAVLLSSFVGMKTYF